MMRAVLSKARNVHQRQHRGNAPVLQLVLRRGQSNLNGEKPWAPGQIPAAQAQANGSDEGTPKEGRLRKLVRRIVVGCGVFYLVTRWLDNSPEINKIIDGISARLGAANTVLPEPLPNEVLAGLAAAAAAAATDDDEEIDTTDGGDAPRPRLGSSSSGITITPSSFFHCGTRVDVAVFSPPSSLPRPVAGTSGSGIGGSQRHPVVINAGTIAAARPYALALAQSGCTVVAYTHGGLTLPPPPPTSQSSTPSPGASGAWGRLQPLPGGVAPPPADPGMGPLISKVMRVAAPFLQIATGVSADVGDANLPHTSFMLSPPPANSPAAAALGTPSGAPSPFVYSDGSTAAAIGSDSDEHRPSGRAAAGGALAVLPGGIPQPPTSDAEADELVGVLRHLSIAQPVVLMSTAYNWLATLKAGLRNRDFVAGLVMVDPLLPTTTHRLPLPALPQQHLQAGGSADGLSAVGGRGATAKPAPSSPPSSGGGNGGRLALDGSGYSDNYDLDAFAGDGVALVCATDDAVTNNTETRPSWLAQVLTVAKGADSSGSPGDDVIAFSAAASGRNSPPGATSGAAAAGGAPLSSGDIARLNGPFTPSALALERALGRLRTPGPLQSSEWALHAAQATQPLKSLMHPAWLTTGKISTPPTAGKAGVSFDLHRYDDLIRSGNAAWFGHDGLDSAYYRSQVVGASLGHFGVVPPGALVQLVRPLGGGGGSAGTSGGGPAPKAPLLPSESGSSSVAVVGNSFPGGSEQAKGSSGGEAPRPASAAKQSTLSLSPCADVRFTPHAAEGWSPWGGPVTAGTRKSLMVSTLASPAGLGADAGVAGKAAEALDSALPAANWVAEGGPSGVQASAAGLLEGAREAAAQRATAFPTGNTSDRDGVPMVLPARPKDMAGAVVAPGGGQLPRSSPALAPDHRKEYVYQQIEALKSESLVMALQDQAHTVAAQYGIAAQAPGYRLPDGFDDWPTLCMFSTSLGNPAALLPPHAPDAGHAAGMLPPRGLAQPILAALIQASGADTHNLASPAQETWTSPLVRLAMARALVCLQLGQQPLRMPQLQAHAPKIDEFTRNLLAIAEHQAAELRAHAQRERGLGAAAPGAPSSQSPSSSWWGWLTGRAQSPSAAAAADAGAPNGGLLNAMPVNAARQQSRPLGPLHAELASACAASGPSTAAAAHSGKITSAVQPVLMPVASLRDAVTALALRTSTLEPYRSVYEPAHWNATLSQLLMLTPLIDAASSSPAQAARSPADWLRRLDRGSAAQWHRMAASPLCFTRHWDGLLAWVRANCAGAQSAFQMDRDASGATGRMPPLTDDSEENSDAEGEGGGRAAIGASPTGSGGDASRMVPFPVTVLVTCVPDDRVTEKAHGWPELAWHHTVGVGPGGVARVSRVLGLSLPAAAAPSPGDVHSRLLLQAHQRAMHAFWQLALPGCVIRIAPETHGEVGASLKQAEAQLRGAVTVRRAYEFMPQPPFVRSVATLQLTGEGDAPATSGATGAVGAPTLLPRSSGNCASPLAVLSDALAYGPAQLHRPPVARVAREAARLAERPLLR